jgi:hypothetical protein
MQHFLKATTGTAGAWIISAEFLAEFFVTMYFAESRA